MTPFFLRVTDKAPYMTQTVVPTNTTDYEEAVEQAITHWKMNRQGITIHTGPYDMHYWYRIDRLGVAEDRNKPHTRQDIIKTEDMPAILKHLTDNYILAVNIYGHGSIEADGMLQAYVEGFYKEDYENRNKKGKE